MRARPVLISCLLCLAAHPAALPAQDLPAAPRKQARAARVNGAAITVDGRLDEAAWRDVPAITGFVQREPALLARQAVTVSGDSLLRLGNYEVLSYLGMTRLDGSAAAIERVQRASAHLLQRPDAAYLRFDPTRTSLTGAKGGISIETQNARHWLWELSTAFESPEFEANDIGRLTAGDGVELAAELEYRDTTPRRLIRQYSIVVGQAQEWNFGGDRQTNRLEQEVGVTWGNFWETELSTRIDFRRQDMRLTRGGPSMERPRVWRSTLELFGREAAQTRLTARGSYGGNEDGGSYAQLQAGLSMRPGPQWQVAVTPNAVREVETQQYIATQRDATAATLGARYVFGVIDRTTYSAQVRLGYTFKPDLNLDFYGEPFAASGRYSGVGALAAARTRTLVPLDPTAAGLGDLDFAVRSFRSNLVLRWEWRPGNTIFLVWQQDRSGRQVSSDRASIGDMFAAIRAPGSSFFAVKASFWFAP